MNLYTHKISSVRIQSWAQNVPIGRGIFDLYPTRGDFVSSAAVNIASTLDGPGVVVRYNNLTLNHVLSTTNRCRSLTVLVDGNLAINSGGGISMTARGAVGNSKMGLYDGYIPKSIDLYSKYLLLADVLQYVKDNSIDVTDRWFWDDFAKNMGVVATFNQGAAYTLLAAAGCGAGGARTTTGTMGGSTCAGNAGAAGSNASGGGGGGGEFGINIGGKGAKGRPWSGGPGGGGVYATSNQMGEDGEAYGGPGGDANGTAVGGGAGNPGGQPGAGGTAGADGTGGILRIIVKGNVTINTGGIVSADGSNGGNGPGSVGGGGSAGGHISIVHLGSYTNSGTARANGGAGGIGANNPGGNGGAGSVVTKTFTQMGWD